MRILVLALNYYPELVGCGKFTKEMVDWLSVESNKIIVITTNAFYPNWEAKSNNYNKKTSKKITIIRCPIYIPKNPNGIKRSLHYLSFFISSFPVVIYYGFKKIDVAFAICPTLLSAPNILIITFLKKLLGMKKLTSWIHFADLEIEAAFQLKFFKSNYLKKFLLAFEKFILNKFDYISSISLYMNKKIRQKINNKNNVYYLPDFIETKDFTSIDRNKTINPYYKELGIVKDKKIIMYSGSINEKLSYETLVDAIKILDERKDMDILWIICGNGPKKPYLMKRLKKNINVKFYDFQPHEKLPYWLNIADIHLIPQKLSSVKFCLPSKLLGILASGKAVIGIAPQDSELGNILDHYGIRLSNENPKNMADALVKLLQNKELREKLGENSKKYIKTNHEKSLILGKVISKIKEFN